MILISTFYNYNHNGKIIEEKIMVSINNDLKKILFILNETQEYYDKVEKLIQLLNCLSSVVLNTNSRCIFNGLDKFLQEQLNYYEEAKCISKKIRLVCKNIFYKLKHQFIMRKIVIIDTFEGYVYFTSFLYHDKL